MALPKIFKERNKMKICKICGKTVSANHVKICRICYLAKSKFEIVHCVDCGEELNIKACYRGDKRCKSCARIEQYRLHPETNPQFGKTGELSSTWKGGEEVRKRFCIDCNKELNRMAYQEGNKRCKHCARIEQYKNPENHPNWLGGLSRLPYTIEFNASLKESIRDRDNHKCQNCGKTEEQEIKDYNKVLAIHHIDYDKENCQDTNLISLCCECNTKANKNRDYWFAFFTEIINSILVS
jgi:hypothetical protein